MILESITLISGLNNSLSVANKQHYILLLRNSEGIYTGPLNTESIIRLLLDIKD